jgi:hypothetical protein
MPRVELANDIAAVARAVRDMGDDRTVVTEMAKSIKADVGASARPALRAASLAYLPKRNGLAEFVAKSRVTVKVKRGAGSAGVSIDMTRKKKTKGKLSDLPKIDAGKLRHPVYGNRTAWTLQKVKPGFVSVGMTEAIADDAVAAILKAVDAAWEKVGASGQ